MRWLALLALAVLLPGFPSRAEDAAKARIIYSRKEGDRCVLHIMNEDGTGDRVIPGQVSDVNLFPTVSPDGKRVAFTAGPKLSFQECQIAVMNLDGTGYVTMNANARVAALPAWSPDGSRIAFAAGDMAPNVYTADPDGTALQQVNEVGTPGIAPFWVTKDKLGFVGFTQSETKSSILHRGLNGGATENIVELGGMALVGAQGLSPDGKRLAFNLLNQEEMTMTFKIMDLETKSEVVIGEVNGEGGGEQPHRFAMPAWSADGKSVIVSLPTDKGLGIFKISADGQTKTRLTPEGMDCASGAWVR
jgi:Tol biopolymer transport system component